MHHKPREKYRAGEPAVGTFFNMGDPSVKVYGQLVQDIGA